MPTEFTHSIAKPEWLDDGLASAMKTFRLAQEGKIPESIKGWMLKVACMRVLRAVYGDDLSTVAALRESVLDKEARMAEFDKGEK